MGACMGAILGMMATGVGGGNEAFVRRARGPYMHPLSASLVRAVMR